MHNSAITIIRKPPTSGDKPGLAAKARSTVRKALAPLLTDLTGYPREIMADAILDVALSLHAQIHSGAETARKVCGWAGRNYPDVPAAKVAVEQAEAVFKGRAA